MSRRPEGWAHEVRGVLGDLTQVVFDLRLGGPPREVGVGLIEADRPEGAHHCGARESLGEEERARVGGLDVGEHLLPERNGLRMRVVDAEDRDPVANPDLDDRPDRLVDPTRIIVEVQRVDILVLLGWVLRVGDGAVGAGREPLGVLAHPGVVGGALEGEVQGDLQPKAARAGDKPIEVVEIT